MTPAAASNGPSRAAVATVTGLVGLAAVLTIVFGLAVYVGVPLAISLLIFPALGAKGWLLAGLTLGVALVWGSLLSLLRRLPRKR